MKTAKTERETTDAIDIAKLRPQLPLTHHLWIPTNGAIELEDLWLQSLASWRPCPQTLWSFWVPTNMPPDVEWRDLQPVMKRQWIHWMLNGDIPVQISKDIAPMLIVYERGGFFADMDIVWRGLYLSQYQGDCFVGEHRPVQFRTKRRATLSPFAMPARSSVAKDLAALWRRRYVARAQRVHAGAKERINWENCSEWMNNTRQLLSLIHI